MCSFNSRTIQDTGFFGRRAVNGIQLECSKCAPGEAPTREGRFCIECPKIANATDAGCQCPSGYILQEREVNGSLLSKARCVKCASGSIPSKNQDKCQPCLYNPILKGYNQTCECTLIGGMCLPLNYKSDGLPYSPSQSDSYVKFSKGKKVDSAFFKTHLEATAYMCNVSSIIL